VPHQLHVYLSIEYKGNIANFKGFEALFNPNSPYLDLACLPPGVRWRHLLCWHY